MSSERPRAPTGARGLLTPRGDRGSQTPFPPCPHCGQPLARFSLPDEGGWDGTFQLACFNDDCPYFVRGWAWMEEHYGVRSSYRYRLDPGQRPGLSDPGLVAKRAARPHHRG